MNPSTFNPLDPENIQPPLSKAEKRLHRLHNVYPWYFATCWAIVVTGLLWQAMFEMRSMQIEAPVYCQGITLPPPSLCIEPLIPPLPPEPIKELPPEPEIVEPVWSCGVAQEDSDPKPGDFIFVEEEPHPTNMMDLIDCIKYPGYLSQAEITGAVVVRILVDEYGHYRKHIIIRQAHPALAKAVEACIDQLQFTPAIQGKQPIKFWVNVPFTFRTYE